MCCFHVYGELRYQPLRTQCCPTRRVSDLRSAGEPDFGTPDCVKEGSIGAIRGGQTKYTLVDGTIALKVAIRGKFRRDNGLDYGRDQITVNVGGKHTLFNAQIGRAHV